MKLVGLLVTIAGFLIAVGSLSLASGVWARFAIVILGILVSLFGIIGLLNQAYLKGAPWRK